MEKETLAQLKESPRQQLQPLNWTAKRLTFVYGSSTEPRIVMPELNVARARILFTSRIVLHMAGSDSEEARDA